MRAIEWRAPGTALTAFGEFEPRWREAPFDTALQAELGQDFDPQERPLAEATSAVRVLDSRVSSSSWDLSLETTEPTIITLYLLYYPRWQGTLDGQPIELRPQPETGYVQMDLPPGRHTLALRYARSVVESLGLVISVSTALALVVVTVISLLRQFRRRHSIRASNSEECDVAPTASQDSAPPTWLLLSLAAFVGLKLFVIDPFTTLFRCQSTEQRVCGADTTVNVTFVGGPRLRGYAVPIYEAEPSGIVRLNLFWEARPNMAQSLQSFVHIRNSSPDWPENPRTGNGIWAQEEHIAPGGLLMRDWVSGRIYLDEYRIRLPHDIPPGEYLLEVGWFDAVTGEQLEVLTETVELPLSILWRSVLLPSVIVK